MPETVLRDLHEQQITHLQRWPFLSDRTSHPEAWARSSAADDLIGGRGSRSSGTGSSVLRMTEFRDQDLSGARFVRTNLRGAAFNHVFLNDADLRAVDFRGVRMRGVELVDVEISAELRNVVVNGVDIAPLVEAELNRRMPERAKMRAEDAGGFREAWAILERLWEGTLARARRLPEAELHRNVDGEWSFIQTLRHLNFASAAWVGRMVIGTASPWHALDLPWDEAPGWDGIPWDREARPSLDEVLAVRRERQAMVRSVMESLTDERLASTVTRTEPGWPQLEGFPVKTCLRIVLNEEWEHRLYAERDLPSAQPESGAPEQGRLGDRLR
ncbi:Pentapeptide repeat-containing protein [Allokutzneria albata]|uniref:Pentapeptide repeat-containing protein n=1 Tax=Allokutzneria albata TaxID=211114 RepID=A0A1G9SVI3_ALLAB|nr:Pentapeptide repeat-containing protein [Allokutzneria albata]